MKIKEKKKVLDKVTNTRRSKKSIKEITKNKDKYELLNVVPENGDSIYSPQFEEFSTFEYGGHVFVAETAIKELVNLIIDQRLGPLFKK